MWKDWFFFTKSQKTGILTLIVIILALLVAKMIILSLPTRTESEDNFEAEARIFLDSLKQISQKHYYHNFDKHEKSNYASSLATPILSHFNPNTADSVQLVKLGIQPRIASNILKYRRKGGKFRKAEDFEKVWGLTTQQKQTFIPYIDIPVEAPSTKTTFQPRIVKTEGIIELNSADTTQLQQIRGIGSGFAKRITGYRRRLGGFIKKEQLLEVWGMTPELYHSIAEHISINTQLIQAIYINKASIEKLKYHPYLNFYKAKAIYELRLSKGAIKSISELLQLKELDQETLSKIAPYLIF